MQIAIVGGGPAGALAAGKLAAAGRSVLLFHDSSRPEKPCGGGVPWRTLAGVPALLDPGLPRKVIRRLVLLAPSGRRAEIELDAPVHVFSRARLDAFLRDRAVEAGAVLVPRHVRSIRRVRRPGGASFVLIDDAGETWQAGFVAGADGAGSLVRRTLLGSHSARVLSYALGWYVEGVTDDRLIVGFQRGLAGYAWCFPRPDHLAVGICAPLDGVRAADLRACCRRFAGALPDGLGEPAGRWRRYAALIPAPQRDRTGRIVVEGKGWALLGDAAGAVDPLTREGIHYALETADLWAGAMLRPEDGTYTARFEGRFPREFGWAAEHTRLFFEPSFTERLVRYADSSAAIRRVLSDLVAGRQPYATLKRRLMLCAVPLAVSLTVRRLPMFSRPRRARTTS